MHADIGQPDSLVRYIRFPQLVAGRGGADYAGVVGQLTAEFEYQVLSDCRLCVFEVSDLSVDSAQEVSNE